jgi:hypothetical protein
MGRPRKEDKLTPSQKQRRYRDKKKAGGLVPYEIYLPLKGEGAYPQMNQRQVARVIAKAVENFTDEINREIFFACVAESAIQIARRLAGHLDKVKDLE